MINRKKRKINTAVLLIIIGAILLTSIGVTLAYLSLKTPEITNNFVPAAVSCKVEEQFEDGVKSQVKVRNTGDASAYIRAAVVVNFVNDLNGSVLSTAPVEGQDYTLTFEDNLAWKKGADGYYYHKQPVAVNSLTNTLISSAQALNEPEGYSLSIQILASAIQSDPPKAVQESWGVTIRNKEITPK